MSHWFTHAISSGMRAAKLRWLTRNGFTVSETPEFAPEAVDWFRARIAKTTHYIEYGSGASTILAAKSGAKTVSMEGDPYYARSVRAALPANADTRLLDAGIGLTEEWSFPVFTRPTASRLAGWKAYAERPLQIAASEGWCPQLILVDGRFRRSCALHAAKAVVTAKEKATLFFDDYVPRPHYHTVEKYLGQPRMVGLSAIFKVGMDTLSETADISADVLAEAVADVY